MCCIQATVDEVLKALKNIYPSKACGPDQIPGRVLRECSSAIAPSQTRLINISLSVSCVPQTAGRVVLIVSITLLPTKSVPDRMVSVPGCGTSYGQNNRW